MSSQAENKSVSSQAENKSVSSQAENKSVSSPTSSAMSSPDANALTDAGGAPSASASSAPAAVAPSRDASASSCRALRGPVELPLRGPAALVVRGDQVSAVLDDDGHAVVVSFPVDPITPTTPTAPVRELSQAGTRSVIKLPCAIARDVAFCPDRSGAVHRTSVAGEGDVVVASSRRGTRVAAAPLGGGHTALGYLASRTTSEGWVSEAWVKADDESPARLSEDGSGATAIDFAPRANALLALIVDARIALTALHARPVGYEAHVHLGEDAVVFVGGPGDRRTAAALAVPPTGSAWALLPIAKDVRDFGLAIVRVDDPPHVDEPVVWSLYPNGLDPAPVAAALGNKRIWIARVRPHASSAAALRDLELGELGDKGDFTPRDIVPTQDSPSDVSLAVDGRGALWISWFDSTGSWLERFACR